METTTPPPPTDARSIGEQLATGPRVTFAAQGFWLEMTGGTQGGRAYVDIAPLRTETSVRLIDGLRRWAA